MDSHVGGVDLALTLSVTDVRSMGDLVDYTGDLQASFSLCITDQYSGAPLDEPATLEDIDAFQMTTPCAATASSTIGSACGVATTANSLVPGIARRATRAIWELGQVQVIDGGEDWRVSTAADNTLFLKQGLFVP